MGSCTLGKSFGSTHTFVQPSYDCGLEEAAFATYLNRSGFLDKFSVPDAIHIEKEEYYSAEDSSTLRGLKEKLYQEAAICGTHGWEGDAPYEFGSSSNSLGGHQHGDKHFISRGDFNPMNEQDAPELVSQHTKQMNHKEGPVYSTRTVRPVDSSASIFGSGSLEYSSQDLGYVIYLEYMMTTGRIRA